jgi:hypothetical protein
MPLTIAHEYKIQPNVVPTVGGESKYKFKAICGCQWEFLATTEDLAKRYADAHVLYHVRFGG